MKEVCQLEAGLIKQFFETWSCVYERILA